MIETLLAALVLDGYRGEPFTDEWHDLHDAVWDRLQHYACWEGWSRLEHRRAEVRS